MRSERDRHHLETRLHALKHLIVYAVLPLAALVALGACAPLPTLDTIAGAGGGFTLTEGTAYGTLPRQKSGGS